MRIALKILFTEYGGKDGFFLEGASLLRSALVLVTNHQCKLKQIFSRIA